MSKPDLVIGTVEQARNMVGTELAPRRGALPVSQAMVQLFCGVTEDANPGYWDEDFARTQWGGLISPPAMLMSWVAGLPWVPGGSVGIPPAAGVRIPLPGDRLVNAVHEAKLHRPIRVGDHLTIIERIESLSEEKRTWLGSGHFVTTQSRILDDEGALVAEQCNQLFRYIASERGGSQRESSSGPEVGMAAALPIPDLNIEVTRLRAIMVPATTLDFLPGHYDPASESAIQAGGLSVNTTQLLGLFNRHATDWAGPRAMIISQRLRIMRPLVEGRRARVSGSSNSEETADGKRVAIVRATIQDGGSSIVARCEIRLHLNCPAWVE